jgi:ribosome-associated toxin RatA of RatAB toxin-antitoxin module
VTVDISQTITVDAPIEQTYDAFADLNRWPAILPDTVGVNIFYSDGYHQEFSMTVERPGGLETVRGFRWCRAPYELELVQTTPPPLMRRMSGLWRFTEAGDGTTQVTATRRLELKSPEEGGPAGGEGEFAGVLGSILQRNLQRFKEAIERD